jgi:hypothetical protein
MSWTSLMPSLRALVPGAARRPRASTRRPQHTRARLGLEALEDRMVPTVVFNPVFGSETVTGSKVGMLSPRVDLVFQGASWTPANENPYIKAVGNILSGPYLSGLTQYGSDGKAVLSRVWNDANSLASNPSTGALQSFLQSSITKNNAAPGQNDQRHAPIYVVISDIASSKGSTAAGTPPGTTPRPPRRRRTSWALKSARKRRPSTSRSTWSGRGSAAATPWTSLP